MLISLPPSLSLPLFCFPHSQVRVDAARESKQVLEALGVTYTKYVEEPRLQHSFSPAELRIVNEFIDERFKAAASSPLATAEKK